MRIGGQGVERVQGAGHGGAAGLDGLLQALAGCIVRGVDQGLPVDLDQVGPVIQFVGQCRGAVALLGQAVQLGREPAQAEDADGGNGQGLGKQEGKAGRQLFADSEARQQVMHG